MERRLTAIPVYDVVGYSRAIGPLEARTLDRLNSDRREVVACVAALRTAGLPE